jgi:hypothetical protein
VVFPSNEPFLSQKAPVPIWTTKADVSCQLVYVVACIHFRNYRCSHLYSLRCQLQGAIGPVFHCCLAQTHWYLQQKTLVDINKIMILLQNFKNVNQGFDIWSGPLVDGSTIMLVRNNHNSNNEVYVDLLQDCGILNSEWTATEVWIMSRDIWQRASASFSSPSRHT